MPKKIIVNSPKNKLKTEKYSGRVVDVADAGTQLNYGSIFIFKGFPEYFEAFFTKNESYFYGAAFFTSILSNVAYLFRFIVTPNKNISRFANLAIRAVSLGFLLLLTFGIAALAGPAMTLALGASVLLYPLVHLVKTSYFLFKHLTADDLHEKFFYEKFIRNMLITTVSLLLVAGLAALFLFAPAIAVFAPTVLMVIGVAGAAIMLAAQVWKIVPFIKNLFHSEPKTTLKTEDTFSLVRKESRLLVRSVSRLSMNLGILKGEPEKPKVEPERPKGTRGVSSLDPAYKRVIESVNKFEFFQYSVTRTIGDDDKAIENFKGEVAILRDNVHDHHKKRALEFLEEFINKMDELPESALKTSPVKIQNGTFYYKDKKELVEKIDQYVLKKNPRAYCSFFKDVGRVQAMFRATYHKFLSKDTKEESSAKKASKSVSH